MTAHNVEAARKGSIRKGWSRMLDLDRRSALCQFVRTENTMNRIKAKQTKQNKNRKNLCNLVLHWGKKEKKKVYEKKKKKLCVSVPVARVSIIQLLWAARKHVCNFI